MRLAFGKWLPRLSRPTVPLRNKPRVSVRPRLEWLEERWLPSTFTVTGNSDDPNDTYKGAGPFGDGSSEPGGDGTLTVFRRGPGFGF
jgi:hypothetical protein